MLYLRSLFYDKRLFWLQSNVDFNSWSFGIWLRCFWLHLGHWALTHSSVSQMLKSENPALRCPSWRLSRHTLEIFSIFKKSVGGPGRRWECERWEKPLSDSAFRGHSDIGGTRLLRLLGSRTADRAAAVAQLWAAMVVLAAVAEGLQAPAAPVGACLCREDWKGLALVCIGVKSGKQGCKKRMRLAVENLTTRRSAVPSGSQGGGRWPSQFFFKPRTYVFGDENGLLIFFLCDIPSLSNSLFINRDKKTVEEQGQS